jgi:hypothetical protein
MIRPLAASKRFGIKIVTIIAGALLVWMTVSACLQPFRVVDGKIASLDPSLPPMNLTLVALNGTQLVLNEVDIGGLSSYESYGGYKNVLGNIRGLGNYTGVPLITLCNLVGGINANNSLKITAADNYTMTFDYTEVNGDFTTYDNVTGEEIPHNQTLTPILAYYFDDANISVDDGPLRVAIVGPEGLATFSGYWVKQVVKLEIIYLDKVAVTAVTPLKTVVGQNYPCLINVTVADQGFYNDTFNLAVQANGTAFATRTVSLSPGNSTIVVFTWNTTGFAFGDYSISARVNSDSPFAGGSVRVSVQGDANGDGTVDIYDAIILAGVFNYTPISSKWNPNADINGDNVVDIYDAIILANHFNQHYP